jgi:hypothetical protein
MDGFDHQTLGFLVLKKILEVVVDKVSFVDISNEGLKVLEVVVDRFKEVEEALNDLHVGLTEAFIKLDTPDAALDLLIELIWGFKVFEAEQNLLVSFKFLEDKRSRALINLLSVHGLLCDVWACRVGFLAYQSG